MEPDIHFFVQARMSSQRYPGKMLAPIHGTPLIKVLIEHLSQAVARENITVLTSTADSDTPLATYLAYEQINVFRGDLNNVLGRFQAAARTVQTTWVARICGDSPLIHPGVVQQMLRALDTKYDVVTNVMPRTFPKGQSVECIQRTHLLDIDTAMLSEHDKEHVMPYFYAQSSQYHVKNVQNVHTWPSDDLSVDTLADLKRIESCLTDSSSLVGGVND